MSTFLKLMSLFKIGNYYISYKLYITYHTYEKRYQKYLSLVNYDMIRSCKCFKIILYPTTKRWLNQREYFVANWEG